MRGEASGDKSWFVSALAATLRCCLRLVRRRLAALLKEGYMSMLDLRLTPRLKPNRSLGALAIAGLLLLGGLGLASCSSPELFSDRDQTSGRLRYFDNDSASATREHRQQAEMGMGMANGPSSQ